MHAAGMYLASQWVQQPHRHFLSHAQFSNLSLTLLLLVVFRGKASQKMRPLSRPPTILVQSEVQSQDAQTLQNTAKLDQSVLKYPSAHSPQTPTSGIYCWWKPPSKISPYPPVSTIKSISNKKDFGRKLVLYLATLVKITCIDYTMIFGRFLRLIRYTLSQHL